MGLVSDFMDSERRVEVKLIEGINCPHMDPVSIRMWTEKETPASFEVKYATILMRGCVVHALAAEVRYGFCRECLTFYYTTGPDRCGLVASYYA